MQNNLKVKFAAIVFLAILLCQSCCLIYGVGMQRAFAEAAPDTYAVNNLIYINRTGLGKDGVIRDEIECITVTQHAKTSDPFQKLKVIGGNGFAPDAAVDTSKIGDIYEYQQTGETMTWAGYTFDISNMQNAIGLDFINQTVPINSSDFFACGFDQSPTSFPAMEKALIFDSPLNYALAYCADNGYVLRSIVNSTYESTYNMDTLNTYQSTIISHNMIAYTNESPTLSPINALGRYGGSLNADLKPFPIVAFALLALLIVFAIPIVTEWIRDAVAKQTLLALTGQNAKVLANAIDKVSDLANAMLADKTAERQLVMNMYANGTISWSQLQYLLQQIDDSYNPLINNCTADIAAMTVGYFNSTVGLYGEYANGMFDASSWTNWIWDIIYLIVALIIAYIIYVIISKFKGAQQPASTVYLGRI